MGPRKVKFEETKEPGYLDEPQLRQIYYINTPADKGNMDKMEEKLTASMHSTKVNYYLKMQNQSEIQYSRVGAWTPKDITKKGTKKKDSERLLAMYSNGEFDSSAVQSEKIVAVWLTQVKLLEDIASKVTHNKSDHTDVYFILEDDVAFVHDNREKEKKTDWIEQAMCHISKLPADWDMYKFGYWTESLQRRPQGSCGSSKAFNEWSCQQRDVTTDGQWEIMGNQAYAVRPQGAANLLKYLKSKMVMDVDGAMVPMAWQPINQPVYYNSRVPIVWHHAPHTHNLYNFVQRRVNFDAWEKEKETALLQKENKESKEEWLWDTPALDLKEGKPKKVKSVLKKLRTKTTEEASKEEDTTKETDAESAEKPPAPADQKVQEEELGEEESPAHGPEPSPHSELALQKIREEMKKEAPAVNYTAPTIGKVHLEAYFVNMNTSKKRRYCITRQLREQNMEAHRFEAVTWPKKCYSDMKCLARSPVNDCITGGVAWPGISTHGTESSAEDGVGKTQRGVLANWCSHKRLFEKLYVEKVLAKNASTEEEYFLVFEDDVILHKDFRQRIENFILNFNGELQDGRTIKWGSIQIDPFGNTGKQAAKFDRGLISLPSKADGDWFGMHAWLIKKSFLPKVVKWFQEHKAIPIDWIPKRMNQILAWKPHIAENPEVIQAGGAIHPPGYCAKDALMKSTIAGASVTNSKATKLGAR